MLVHRHTTDSSSKLKKSYENKNKAIFNAFKIRPNNLIERYLIPIYTIRFFLMIVILVYVIQWQNVFQYLLTHSVEQKWRDIKTIEQTHNVLFFTPDVISSFLNSIENIQRPETVEVWFSENVPYTHSNTSEFRTLV